MQQELIEVNRCPKCGGEIEPGAPGAKYVQCPYCRTKYINPEYAMPDNMDDDSWDESKPKGFPYFDPEVFKEEWDRQEAKNNKDAYKVIKEMSACLKKYTTSSEVMDYIIKSQSMDPDFATEDINKKLYKKLGNHVKDQLNPGEKILFFVDDGILFHGKSGYVITDQRTFFADNKWQVFVRHDSIYKISIELDTYVHAYLNEIKSTWFTLIGASNTLLGSTLALILRFALEQRDNTDKIILTGTDSDIE